MLSWGDLWQPIYQRAHDAIKKGKKTQKTSGLSVLWIHFLTWLRSSSAPCTRRRRRRQQTAVSNSGRTFDIDWEWRGSASRCLPLCFGRNGILDLVTANFRAWFITVLMFVSSIMHTIIMGGGRRVGSCYCWYSGIISWGSKHCTHSLMRCFCL